MPSHNLSNAKCINWSANLPPVDFNFPLDSIQSDIISTTVSNALSIAPSFLSIPSVIESIIVVPASCILGPFWSIQSHIFIINPSIAESSDPFSLASDIPLHIPSIIFVPIFNTESKLPPLIKLSNEFTASTIPVFIASPQLRDCPSRYLSASPSPFNPLNFSDIPFKISKKLVKVSETDITAGFILSKVCKKVSPIADDNFLNEPLTVASNVFAKCSDTLSHFS